MRKKTLIASNMRHVSIEPFFPRNFSSRRFDGNAAHLLAELKLFSQRRLMLLRHGSRLLAITHVWKVEKSQMIICWGA